MRLTNRPDRQKPEQQGRLSGGWRNLPGCSAGSIVIWLLFGLVIASLVWGPLSNRLTSHTRISYSTFREQVQAGNVAQITVAGQQIEGKLKEPLALDEESGQSAPVEAFVTTLPSFGDDEL
ncbi:MAG: ATP-dependent metallopeptidase FtsH/Yme1/Tma family protein, partial [Anaerolineae bacterium]